MFPMHSRAIITTVLSYVLIKEYLMLIQGHFSCIKLNLLIFFQLN
jgi:hypothetical protein